jgi:hypothetical protein
MKLRSGKEIADSQGKRQKIVGCSLAERREKHITPIRIPFDGRWMRSRGRSHRIEGDTVAVIKQFDKQFDNRFVSTT